MLVRLPAHAARADKECGLAEGKEMTLGLITSPLMCTGPIAHHGRTAGQVLPSGGAAVIGARDAARALTMSAMAMAMAVTSSRQAGDPSGVTVSGPRRSRECR
ncbi:hypothetical protein BGK70_01780 [Streptomyces agglomeratus]|nr:hypothetical protein BGK70_01780 [Streptomyces agglomeratus]